MYEVIIYKESINHSTNDITLKYKDTKYGFKFAENLPKIIKGFSRIKGNELQETFNKTKLNQEFKIKPDDTYVLDISY